MKGRKKGFLVVSSIIDDVVNPFDVIGNLSVDPELSLPSASLSETGHAENRPSAVIVFA